MQRPPIPRRLEQEPLEPSEDDGSSLVLRFGTVVAGGIAAAVAASLPAAMRMGDGGSASRALEQWLALAALLTPIAVAAVGVLRRARAGLRLVAGEHVALAAAGLFWWAVLELGILSVFGALLRKKTHHHGLAGVTFAMFAIVTGVLAAFFALRGVKLLARFDARVQRASAIVAGVSAFLAIFLVGLRTSGAEGLHTAAAMVDLLALGVASAITSSRPFARFRPLAIAGVPVTAIVLLVGLTSVSGDAQLRDTLASKAPVQAFVLETVSPSETPPGEAPPADAPKPPGSAP